MKKSLANHPDHQQLIDLHIEQFSTGSQSPLKLTKKHRSNISFNGNKQSGGLTPSSGKYFQNTSYLLQGSFKKETQPNSMSQAKQILNQNEDARAYLMTIFKEKSIEFNNKRNTSPQQKELYKTLGIKYMHSEGKNPNETIAQHQKNDEVMSSLYSMKRFYTKRNNDFIDIVTKNKSQHSFVPRFYHRILNNQSHNKDDKSSNLQNATADYNLDLKGFKKGSNQLPQNIVMGNQERSQNFTESQNDSIYNINIFNENQFQVRYENFYNTQNDFQKNLFGENTEQLLKKGNQKITQILQRLDNQQDHHIKITKHRSNLSQTFTNNVNANQSSELMDLLKDKKKCAKKYQDLMLYTCNKDLNDLDNRIKQLLTPRQNNVLLNRNFNNNSTGRNKSKDYYQKYNLAQLINTSFENNFIEGARSSRALNNKEFPTPYHKSKKNVSFNLPQIN